MSFDFAAMEHIRQQKAKYCRYLDTKKFDEWETLFLPDVKVVYYNLDGSVMAKFDSLAELSSGARGLFATTQSIHQTHNSEVELTSETAASATWSMEDWHVYAPEADSPSKTMHGYGFYYETWKLVDGEWKIARLELRRNIVLYT